MSKTINQHYVPQFLIRKFGTGNRVKMFNILKEKFVPSTAIKNQSSEDYFYVEQEIEDLLSELEGKASKVLAEIENTLTLPETMSPEFVNLSRFITAQRGRTKTSEQDVLRHMKGVLDAAVAEHPELSDLNPDDYELHAEGAVLTPLATALESAIFLSDLERCLLHNKTNYDFCLSDHPVVLYNKLCERAEGQGGLGYVKSGLMVFLPINPRLTLLLYDGHAYDMSCRNGSVAEITTEADVRQLNRLQWASAFFNVYLSPDTSEEEARSYLEQAREDRQIHQTRTEVYDQLDTDGDGIVFGIGDERQQDSKAPVPKLIRNTKGMPNVRLSLKPLSLHPKLRWQRRRNGRRSLAKRLSSIRRQWRDFDGDELRTIIEYSLGAKPEE